MLSHKEFTSVQCLEDSILCIGSFIKHQDIADLENAFKLISYTAPDTDSHIQFELKQLMSKYQELSSLGRQIEEFLYYCTHKLNYCLLHLSYTIR